MGSERGDTVWILAAGALVVIQLWFGMISTSLWLDETGTWWIVKDGAAEAVRRSFNWSGQSPFYYLIAWASSRFFGLNEIGLRIPSVLAMCGALALLYRIAERIYDRAAAAVVVFVFLCVGSFYAVDARPYALALFCITAAFWALLRWLDTGRVRYAVFYAIAAAATVYAHCILALPLAAVFIYGALRLWKKPRRLAWLAGLHLAIIVLSLPLVPELRTFYADRSAHAFLGLPTGGDLLAGLIPCSLAGALILLIWVWMNLAGEADIAGKCAKDDALLVGMWALLAPLTLFLLPAVSDLRLFVDRYYSSSLPGQALLAGGLLSSIRRNSVRRGLVAAVAVGFILVQGRMGAISHGDDDWRDALAFLKTEAGNAPVLLISPFAEGGDFHSLNDPRLREILFAPEEYYGEPVNSIRLPHVFPLGETAALDKVTEPLARRKRFYILSDKPDRSYEIWLLGRFGPGCSSAEVGRHFGLVRIDRFICSTPGS